MRIPARIVEEWVIGLLTPPAIYLSGHGGDLAGIGIALGLVVQPVWLFSTARERAWGKLVVSVILTLAWLGLAVERWL